LIGLGIFVILMGILTYFAFDWLGSLTAPIDVKTNYEFYMASGRQTLWFSTLILLILANIIFWKLQKSWAFWSTLLYFVFFILIQSFWLDRAFEQFKENRGLSDGTLSISPIIGIILCIFAAVFVYFNQFLVKRMYDKMFNKENEIKELPEETDEADPVEKT